MGNRGIYNLDTYYFSCYNKYKVGHNGVLMVNKIDSIMLRPFAEGLASDQYIDPFVDIGDIAINTLLSEDSVFKEIPIITTGRLLCKAGITIQKAFEIKNQLIFLQGIQTGKLELEGFAKRQDAFRNNEPWFYREVERLVVYISRNTDIRKAKIQAALYLDYVGHKITQEVFYEYLDIIDQLLVGDIQHMLELDAYQKRNGITTDNLNESNAKFDFEFDLVKCNRLSSLGLLLRTQFFTFGRTVKSEFLVSDVGSYFSNLIQHIKNN